MIQGSVRNDLHLRRRNKTRVQKANRHISTIFLTHNRHEALNQFRSAFDENIGRVKQIDVDVACDNFLLLSKMILGLGLCEN